MRLRKDTRMSMTLALLAIVLLLAFGGLVLQAIEGEYRRKVADHINSTLDSMVRLLDLMYEDAMGRVRTIAEEPRLKEMVGRLADGRGRAGLHAEFAAWITPIYRSRGFEGYSLIAADRRQILTSGSPAYIGQEVATEATRTALSEAERNGAGVARPTPAPRPVVTHGVPASAGLAFQNACARIDDGGRVLGFLCLRDNPQLRLYRVLDAGRTGGTGETYVIDSQGRILSPIRFERDLSAPEGAVEGWSLFRLFASAPGRDGRPAGEGGAPLTRVAAALIENAGDSGLQEDYPDYRGRRVVGAGRWLPALGMGIVVEEDMDEAYRSYRFARDTLIGLLAIAVVLILSLSALHWRSRRSLARSEQQMAAFRDHIPAGMHLKDREGRYLMTNPVFEAVFGLPPGAAIGRTDAELMPAGEAARRQSEHEQVVRSGQPFQYIYTTRFAGSGEKTYSVVRFPILGEDEATVTAVGTVGLDVTDHLRTQRELEELTQTLEQRVQERTEELATARDMAEAAGRAKAEFLANMSHEIRTPLNAIIGMSHLAARVNAEPQVARYIERIQDSGQHLLGIVNEILDLSKIEAGKLQIDSVEFSLERTLEHVAGLVWERADAKGLELIIDIAPGIPDRLVGDPLRIGQILINFANNAVKFTEQGEVVLRVRMPHCADGRATLRFEVEDTGIGIAEDKLPLLFSPFQQLDGSMSRRYEGTGLGLAISKDLAELMGGRVDVRTRFGEGSVFSLEIDLRTAADGASPIRPAIDLRNRRVLAVDDNAHARRQLVVLLQSLSFRVDEAADGQEAVGRIADADAGDAPYEIVFLDWKMPGMGGAEVAAQIRLLSLRRPLPRMVLIAAGGRSPTDAESGGAFDAVLCKPVTPSELFDAVIALFDPARLAARPTAGNRTDWPDLSGADILLVEDNPINQEVVHDLLRIAGARVTIAGDGLRALQLLNNQPFDAVLMDVHMPIMNGFEATAEIRKEARFARLPVIALTANALEGDRERCVAAGMNDYVAKPIDPARFFATLLRHLPAPGRSPGSVPATAAAAASASPGAATESDRLLAALAKLPGVDVAAGLSRVMDRADLYLRLGQRIMNERADLPVQLMAAAVADREQLRGLIHGMKSLLGAFGAVALQQRCIDIEALLGSDAPVVAEVEAFCGEYAMLIRRLREIMT